MSAWIPSVAHIDLLVTRMIGAGAAHDNVTVSAPIGAADWELGSGWLAAGRTFTVSHETADLTGRILLSEVVASVSYRYRGAPVTELPGTLAELPLLPDLLAGGYRWRPTGRDLPAIAVIKAVHCYQYQACEHDAWQDSLARALTDALAASLVYRIPGYSEAPWGYDRPSSEPVAILDMLGGAR